MARILVVEDDPVQQMLVRRIAERAGYAADCAADPRSAIALLEQTVYGSVILDLSLGEDDGISVLQPLSRSRPVPQLVLVSGFDDRIRLSVMRLAQRLGIPVAGTLRKPVTPAGLRTLLSTRAPTACAKRAPTTLALSHAELAQALAGGEIGVAFQPKVDLTTGRPVGAEALARWHSPVHGHVGPAVFIPAIEQAGLIQAMTAHSLTLALRACVGWRARYPAMSVAVNVAPQILNDAGFPDQVEAALHAAGLPPGALILEITEGNSFDNEIVAAQVLTRLRVKGVGLSIDDFGTGYSSLHSLLHMPFGELKIDQSFARSCDTDQDAWKIVRASLLLGHEFGMTVTAEGIETASVAERLRDAGCDTAQGWLYGRAMPHAEFESWLGMH